MSKAVLISIKPKWCELIASGKKTIEVRKTKPKLQTPFKCYIYCTKSFENNTPYSYKTWAGCGKVIGEFVCDKLVWVVSHPSIFAGHDLLHKAAIDDACLTESEAEQYADGKDVYGWHISDLVIYDRPKSLGEFCKPCIDEEMQYCPSCKYGHEIFSPDEVECSADLPGASYDQICLNRLKTVPQSWCYVEELQP